MTRIGRDVYALGAIALGAVQLAYGRFSADWLPVPAGLPGYHLVAEACGLVLIVAGAALWFSRTAAAGALGLAGLFIAAMLALHLPPALARPMVWGVWQAAAESTAMGAGGMLAWTLARPRDDARARRAARGARLVFGLCLVVFGISHFVYAGFTASLVPVWLAPSPMFWTYATGIAQIAAGLAFLSGVRARPAAISLTAMYLIFGLLVHLPSVAAKPSLDSWTENAVNLLLVGAAWCMAEVMSRRSAHPVV